MKFKETSQLITNSRRYIHFILLLICANIGLSINAFAETPIQRTAGGCSPIIQKIVGDVKIDCTDPAVRKFLQLYSERLQQLHDQQKDISQQQKHILAAQQRDQSEIKIQLQTILEIEKNKSSANDPKAYDRFFEAWGKGDLVHAEQYLSEAGIKRSGGLESDGQLIAREMRNKAALWISENQDKSALFYRKAAKAEPRNPLNWYLLGRTVGYISGIENHRELFRSEAIECFENVIMLSEHEPLKKAFSYRWLARLKEDPIDQLNALNSAKAIFKMYSATGPLAQTNLDIANYYNQQGNVAAASGSYVEAANGFKKSNLNLDAGQALYAMAEMYRALGDIEKSIATFDEAMKIFTLAGDSYMVFLAQRHKLDLYMVVGEYDSAEKYFKSLLKGGDRSDEEFAVLFNSMAEGFHNSGDLYKAIRYYSDAKELNLLANKKPSAAIQYLRIGLIYEKLGNFEKAESALIGGLSISIELDNSYDSALYYQELEALYRNNGQQEKAAAAERDSLKAFPRKPGTKILWGPMPPDFLIAISTPDFESQVFSESSMQDSLAR